MRKAFTGVFLTIFLLFAGVFTIYCIPEARDAVFVKLLGGKSDVVEDNDDDLYIALTGDYPADVVVPDTVEKVRNGALYGVTINSLDLNNKPVDFGFAQYCTVSSVADEYTANTIATTANMCYFPNKIVTSGITGGRNNVFKHLVVNNVTTFSGSAMWANILELNLSSEIDAFNLSTLNNLQGNRLLKLIIPAGLEQCPISADQITAYFNARLCVSIVCVSDGYYDEFLNSVPEHSKGYVIPLSKYAGETVEAELVNGIVLQTQTVYKIDTENNVLIAKSNYNGTNPSQNTYDLADYYISHSNNGREYFFYVYWTTDTYGRPQLVHGAIYAPIKAQTLDYDISYKSIPRVNGVDYYIDFVATTDGTAYVLFENGVEKYECLVDTSRQFVSLIRCDEDDFDLYGVFRISDCENVEFLYVGGDICNFSGDMLMSRHGFSRVYAMFNDKGVNFYGGTPAQLMRSADNYFVYISDGNRINIHSFRYGSVYNDIVVIYSASTDSPVFGHDYVMDDAGILNRYTFSKENFTVKITWDNFEETYSWVMNGDYVLIYRLTDTGIDVWGQIDINDLHQMGTRYRGYGREWLGSSENAYFVFREGQARWLIANDQIYYYVMSGDIDDYYWVSYSEFECALTTRDGYFIVGCYGNVVINEPFDYVEDTSLSTYEYRDKIVAGDESFFISNSAFHFVDIPTVYLKSMYFNNGVPAKYKLTNDTVYVCDPDTGEYVLYDDSRELHYKLWHNDKNGIMVLEILDENYCVIEVDAGWNWTFDTTTDSDPDYTNLTLEDLETGKFYLMTANDTECPYLLSDSDCMYSVDDTPVFKIDDSLAYIYYNGEWVVQNPSTTVRLYQQIETGWYVLYVSDNFAIDDPVEGAHSSNRRSGPVILQAKDPHGLTA